MTGKIWGSNQRCMLTLPVSVPGRASQLLNVHFLVDTGSPLTYLTTSALKALNFPPEELGNHYAQINGVDMMVFYSHEKRRMDNTVFESHFGHTNLLGLNFLSGAKAKFEVSFAPPSPICRLRMPTS